ncbi:fucose-binding lectin II [Photorhabdus africana]|uniref:fucose-binding lectin II n=1 Tax=Photorhabdus africana TaxID=3097554 RepID=UPI002B407DD9|nr:fucose-binding lectin II [Photorhabdus sp. CRI-LC]
MNTDTYLFLSTENTKYSEQFYAAYNDYPQPINKNWPNLPADFQRHIDDVINLNGYLYFFKGSQYLKFDIAKAQVSDGPKPIVEGWPGLKGTEFENGIDAATELMDIKKTNLTDVVCFFKGGDCIDYTVSSHTINQNRIATRWKMAGKYAGFAENLDAAVLWRTRGHHFIYFFKGNANTRFNLELNTIDHELLSIQSNWKGVTFKKVQAAVSVDTDLLGSDRGNDRGGSCGGECGINDIGKHCFQLPYSIRFGLAAYVNTDIHQQVIKIYIDDLLVDTLTRKGTDNAIGIKTYTSGKGKVCVEIEGDGKPCKLRYAYNTFDGKPGIAVIGAENGSNNNYNDSVVVLNWPLV